MPWKRFIRHCAKHSAAQGGFTLAELLVASSLGMILLAMVLGSTLANRNVYQQDVVRTRLNQDLRGALDLIGMNVRIAGENLPANFPAIEIIDGASGAPDELILRRNLVDEVLKVCQAITAGSGTASLYFAVTGTDPGCVYGDNLNNFSAWQTERQARTGLEAPVYVYNTSSGNGEFFTYINEFDTGTQLYITRSGGTWQYDYDTDGSAAYLIEEWHFRLVNDILEVIVDNDSANPYRVVYGIEDFQVQAVLQDGSTQDSLDSSDDWTELETVRVDLSGSDSYNDQVLTSSLTGRFFPRNILSN